MRPPKKTRGVERAREKANGRQVRSGMDRDVSRGRLLLEGRASPLVIGIVWLPLPAARASVLRVRSHAHVAEREIRQPPAQEAGFPETRDTRSRGAEQSEKRRKRPHGNAFPAFHASRSCRHLSIRSGSPRAR